MIKDDIIREYQQCESIKATASKLGISHGVVRKVLIEEGLFTTPLVERISELRELGYSEEEMGKILKVSSSWLNANMPYTKGTYLNPNKSVNALRIKKCLERKKNRK